MYLHWIYVHIISVAVFICYRNRSKFIHFSRQKSVWNILSKLRSIYHQWRKSVSFDVIHLLFKYQKNKEQVIQLGTDYDVEYKIQNTITNIRTKEALVQDSTVNVVISNRKYKKSVNSILEISSRYILTTNQWFVFKRI